MSQEKSSQNVYINLLAGFGERLREAFDGAHNAEIARKMGLSEPAVKNYIEGRVPKGDMLLMIMSLTNCSLHWLLTGEGPKIRDNFLTKDNAFQDDDGQLVDSFPREDKLTIHLALPKSILEIVKNEAIGEGRSVEDMAVIILSEGAQERDILTRKLKMLLQAKTRKRAKEEDMIEELVDRSLRKTS